MVHFEQFVHCRRRTGDIFHFCVEGDVFGGHVIAPKHRYAQLVRYARAVRSERKRHVYVHQIDVFESFFYARVVRRCKPCVLLLDDFLIDRNLLYGKRNELHSLHRFVLLTCVVAKHFYANSALDEVFNQMPCRHGRAVTLVMKYIDYYCNVHNYNLSFIVFLSFSHDFPCDIIEKLCNNLDLYLICVL